MVSVRSCQTLYPPTKPSHIALMAILKIARMGHPVLKTQAKPVADPTAPEIRQLINDMRETMADAGGVGLAAPQVHIPLRLVIFQVPTTRSGGDDETDGNFFSQVLINPKVEPRSEEFESGWEGCLSVPELRGAVPRYTHIHYEGFDEKGTLIDCDAQGFHARVVQHECDHLDGVLYPMRMSDLTSLHYISEMRFNSTEHPSNETS